MTLRDILTEAYAEKYSSADVRDGICSLEQCHTTIKRPNGEPSWIAPHVVLREVFDPYLHQGFYDRAAISGKVDAPEATRLWREWGIRRGNVFYSRLGDGRVGNERAQAMGAFLLEVGLPVAGGGLLSGRLDPELAQLCGVQS